MRRLVGYAFAAAVAAIYPDQISVWDANMCQPNCVPSNLAFSIQDHLSHWENHWMWFGGKIGQDQIVLVPRPMLRSILELLSPL